MVAYICVGVLIVSIAFARFDDEFLVIMILMITYVIDETRISKLDVCAVLLLRWLLIAYIIIDAYIRVVVIVVVVVAIVGEFDTIEWIRRCLVSEFVRNGLSQVDEARRRRCAQYV